MLNPLCSSSPIGTLCEVCIVSFSGKRAVLDNVKELVNEFFKWQPKIV